MQGIFASWSEFLDSRDRGANEGFDHHAQVAAAFTDHLDEARVRDA